MANNDADRQPITLKRKAADLTVEQVIRPEPSVDILSMFKANSNPRFECSNLWTVDVFPNMIPIIMLVILTSIRHYTLISNRDYSKITPLTLCMYYMSIVYGFFLINDLEVRPRPSAHAQSWNDNSWKRNFVTMLRALPVPEFLANVLSQFHSTQTERTKNVFFVPTAAGFDHNQFFGRIFPVNFFAEIHDCIANLSSSSSQIDVLKYLYTKPLYSIGEIFTCLIPDLIGVTIDQTTVTTANYVNSKLYQVFNCLFNPVLFRDVQRRPTLAALSLEPPTFDNEHINAYDYMFTASSNNLAELQVVLQSVAALISSTIPIKGRLDQFIKDGSGNSILMHGYSCYVLPTWSHTPLTSKLHSFSNIDTLHRVTPSARARDFSFLQKPAAAIPTTNAVTDVTYVATTAPTIEVPLPEGYSLVRHFPGSLRANVDSQVIYPAHNGNDLVGFYEPIHYTPDVSVLDIEGDRGLTAYLATFTGKVIESFEIDGTTISLPNFHRSLGPQNAQFADSAIPYKYVRPGSDFRPRANTDAILPPVARKISVPSSRHAASSLLRSRLDVMLPMFQHQIHEPLGTTLPGMTPVTGAISTRYIQSMIGFSCCDGSSNADNLDDVAAMPTGQLLVWSPYTYTPYESSDWPVPDLSQSRHYYLTNLRTIFGTDYNLVEVDHAYKAFPVV